MNTRWCISIGGVLLIAQHALAQANETEFRRSLTDNLENAATPQQFIAFAVAALALILALVVVTRWRARPGSPVSVRALHHAGKLLKEIGKRVSLKSSEVRQLKILSEQQKVQNPLVLLLCPSVLGEAVKQNPKRLDRQILNGLARKIMRQPG